MKFLLVLLAIVATVAAYDVEGMNEQDWKNFFEDESVTPEEQGLILNSQAKKAVRNVMETMPCGWPEYGIPPLAPYTNPDLEVHLAKSVVDSIIEAIRFRFDGLNEMQIKKLKVSYTFKKKVTFDFNFKELKATAKHLNTDTFIDFLKQLGLTVRYEGSGPLEFALENLRLTGTFKYKMPWLWGSIKIYNFHCTVSLGGVRSNIGGILGNGGINEMINDEIEMAIPAYINGNQNEISAMIEEIVVPNVNAKLKGKKIWDLFSMLGSSSSKCVPEPAPWSAIEN